jgi:hypothetical protein
MLKLAAVAAVAAILAVAVTGCGGSSSSKGAGSGGGAKTTKKAGAPEVNPAGDIPDNQAYVRYTPPAAGFSLKVPEGWSRARAGAATVFTDKLNSIRVESAPARAALSVGRARAAELPKLAASVKGFGHAKVTTVRRHAGTAVRITYLATAPADPVTGRAARDAVERYVFFHRGRDAILTLSGPKGADNVDPWRIITNSVAWSR